MILDVKFLPKELEQEALLTDKVCIVLDIFRASNTILTALQNGCLRIKPTLEVAESMQEKSLHSDWWLAGERKSIKIDGFDFGNSPMDFTTAKMNGRSLIMNTSNGTKAILACKDAYKVFIGAFRNAAITMQAAIEEKRDITVVCAGTEGDFSLEDSLCAGYLAELASTKYDYELTDKAYAAQLMYDRAADELITHAKRSRNGSRLYRIGLANDVEYCLTTDIMDILVNYDKESGFLIKTK